MILVHLSDLHFKKNETGKAFDYYVHLRNELLKDLTEMCEELNEPASAILISGDLTFSGQIEEFEFAESWLNELCSSCKTEFENIFIVPGNHDVDRKITGDLVIQSLHQQIKSQNGHSLNDRIALYLRDNTASQLLYKSLGNYNNFSAKFFCDLLPPNRTIAKRDLILNDGSTLRLHGLNSSFVSSAADKKEDLFVDPNAFQIVKELGIENLVICHHPYNWIRDGEKLREHLDDVAILQLFGHEHNNRIRFYRDNVTLHASAGHPELLEQSWEPGYNILSLNVDNIGDKRVLDVKVHVRVWQQNPGKFRAKEDKNDVYFHHTIQLANWESKIKSEMVRFPEKEEGNLRQVSDVQAEVFFNSSDSSMNSLRTIALRFFELTLSKRLAIAGKFNLFEDEDVDQPDYEKFRRVLLRAKERGLLEKLDLEIANALQDK
ncbi:Calcineurin-like phosphoesterase family protein [Leptospira santarosai]|uniref:Calcineurin-like phosphoesterase family protein n=1 Tax=Leptospira santarosai TaxID=28183 RepID=A0A2P1QVW1_9LEPT|nr:Calcineurin-like phosphoesterase family protein [Leptospira santarosai]